MAETERRHSKVGIASCGLAVVMFVSFLMAALYLQTAWNSESQARWFHSEGLALLQLVVVMFLPVPVHIIGFVMGAVSLFFPNRKKLFPILAIALNGLYGFLSLIPWIWLALHSSGFK
jgi:hypothetical protein